jgi:hypothetical protein
LLSTVSFSKVYKKTSCKDSIGTLSIYPYGSTYPYKITVNDNINPSDTSFGVFTFKNIKEGTISIKIIDGNGCETTKTDLVRDSFILYTTPLFTGSQCGSTGTLKLSTFGGTRPYKFQLDGGAVQTDSIFKNISPNIHSATITDATGCSKNITFTLQTKGLDVNIDAFAAVCTDTVPQVKISVNGGQAPYQYYVNGILKPANTFKLNTGYYKFEVKDVNGCSDSSWRFIWLKKDSLRVSTTFTKVNCIDSFGTLLVKILNPNPSQFVDYQLDNQAYTSSLSFTNVKRGYHYLKARTTEGCIFETPIYVWDEPLTIVPNIKACFKNDATYLYAPVSTGAALYTFIWSNGATGSSIQIPIPGTYFLTVTNSQGCTAVTKYEIESCVWAGDTDTSGIVDNKDFLNIGLAFGESGFKRDSVNTFWFGQFSKPWSKQTPALTNYKHIDTNGDGVINASDTTAILSNWSRKHNLVNPKGNGMSPRSTAPSIYVKIDKITEGVNVVPIIFGDATAQALGIYGLAYSIDFDENIIDENSVYVTFNGSWFGSNNSLAMYKVADGKVHIALTKTNKINLNGAGQIAQLYFKIKGGSLNKNIVFKTENQIAINSNAQEVPTQTQSTNANVTTGINDKILEQSVVIYPNPASNNLTIETHDLQLKEVAIMDLTGRIIQSYKSENKRFDLPLMQQPAGSYFVKIMTDKGTVIKRFIKM